MGRAIGGYVRRSERHNRNPLNDGLHPVAHAVPPRFEPIPPGLPDGS